jgi:hypothetical protein
MRLNTKIPQNVNSKCGVLKSEYINLAQTGLMFAALTLFAGPAYAFQSSQKSINGLAGAYGYIMGQENALQLIEEKFPELKPAVLMARLEFDSNYPSAKEKINRQIHALIGEDKATEFLKTLEEKVKENSVKSISQTEAQDFIKTVSKRAGGAIERENVKQFLHAVVFHDRPEAELSEKYAKRFSTSGDVKSKGVEVSLKVPLSWEERQGNTPNTVRGWSSEVGTGLSYIGLLVMDRGDRRSKEDIQKAISSKSYTGMLPKDAKLRKIQFTQSSNRPGWYIEYEMTMQRVDMEITQIIRSISILHDGKTVELGCSTGGLASDREKITREFSRFENLCRLVLNSLVIDSVFR